MGNEQGVGDRVWGVGKHKATHKGWGFNLPSDTRIFSPTRGVSVAGRSPVLNLNSGLISSPTPYPLHPTPRLEEAGRESALEIIFKFPTVVRQVHSYIKLGSNCHFSFLQQIIW
jgi:hypothetical protein